MKREHEWKLTVDGVPHQVICRFAGDRYELYADGVYATEVLRQSVTTMWYGMQESVTLFGKACLFVVLDEKPDLVVDGKMIDRGIDYEKALKRQGNRVYMGYGIVLGACVLLLIAVVMMLCMGRAQEIGLYNIFIALGAALTIGAWSGKNLWRLTRK